MATVLYPVLFIIAFPSSICGKFFIPETKSENEFDHNSRNGNIHMDNGGKGKRDNCKCITNSICFGKYSK